MSGWTSRKWGVVVREIRLQRNKMGSLKTGIGKQSRKGWAWAWGAVTEGEGRNTNKNLGIEYIYICACVCCLINVKMKVQLWWMGSQKRQELLDQQEKRDWKKNCLCLWPGLHQCLGALACWFALGLTVPHSLKERQSRRQVMLFISGVRFLDLMQQQTFS
jgi:hypothetical protein